MVEVKNLKFRYDNSQPLVLNDVSFTIEKGEWISIIGHNGSGKSTLAKLLTGLIDYHVGEINIDGIKMEEKNKPELRKKIGIMFQNPDNQFVGYNVKYDIAFGLENHNIKREEMLELIDKYANLTGMENYLEREPNTLSGGQKQRVALAGILALNSDIIILDEATSMLDPEGVDEIIKLILEIHKNTDKTIITITHDLSFAKKSDRIILLKDGKILGNETPNELFSKRDILLSSSLDMPFGDKAYYLASQDEKLNNNKKLMEALWEYHLKM